MTRAGGPRPGAGVGHALILGLVVALCGACALISSTLDTTRALQSEGFANVRVTATSLTDETVLRISGDAPPGASDPEHLAAGAAWQHFAFRFTGVQVSLRGRPSVGFSHDQLAAQLGARPAGYDARTVGASVGRTVRLAVTGGSAVILVVGLLVIALVVRHRRRHPKPATVWPGPVGPPGSPPSWPPPPYAPPAYAPPAWPGPQAEPPQPRRGPPPTTTAGLPASGTDRATTSAPGAEAPTAAGEAAEAGRPYGYRPPASP